MLSRLAVRWVYPRVCGGAAFAESVIRSVSGLSPRVRGSPLGKEVERVSEGSIPACAGEPAKRRSRV